MSFELKEIDVNGRTLLADEAYFWHVEQLGVEPVLVSENSEWALLVRTKKDWKPPAVMSNWAIDDISPAVIIHDCGKYEPDKMFAWLGGRGGTSMSRPTRYLYNTYRIDDYNRGCHRCGKKFPKEFLTWKVLLEVRDEQNQNS